MYSQWHFRLHHSRSDTQRDADVAYVGGLTEKFRSRRLNNKNRQILLLRHDGVATAVNDVIGHRLTSSSSRLRRHAGDIMKFFEAATAKQVVT